MLLVLDAAALRQWCEAGREALLRCRAEIDDLNVFPVADRDTGTNLLLTMESAERALQAAPADLAASAGAVVRGALAGARGNSGVLLSQLLRGVAEALTGEAGRAGQDLAEGLVRGAELATAAVAQPVEGTVLTVATAAGQAALGVARAGGDLTVVARAARDAAKVSLTRTTGQLPALRAAAVVDAGGRGWQLLLDVLYDIVSGRPSGATTAPSWEEPGADRASSDGPAPGAAFGYEVQYLLHGASLPALAELRRRLAGLGDCVAVVGGPELANVHAHVDDIGAAIEVGVAAGRPSRILVTRFADESTSHRPLPVAPPDARSEPPGRPAALAPPARRVVAVATGAGVAALFREGGALVVPTGVRSQPVSARLLAAVRGAGVRQIVVLADESEARTVSEVLAAARRDDLQVVAVSTRSPVQGLAALAVADPDRPLEADLAAMTAAAGSTKWASVTTARRGADTAAGPCLPGDALGLLAGSVVLVGRPGQVATGLLDMLLPTAELLTVLVGAAAPAGLRELLLSHVAARFPYVSVFVVDGGQPEDLLLGVE